jgi:hypothetical protein
MWRPGTGRKSLCKTVDWVEVALLVSIIPRCYTGVNAGVVSVRWLDEQKRVFGVIYWVDLLLILAGLLVVGKAVWNFWPVRPVEKDLPVHITIEAANIHPEVVNSIKLGDWVRDARSGVQLGTIIRKKAVPHYFVQWEEKREIKRRSYPEKYDISVTLRQNARFKAGEGCFIGKLPIRAGRKGVFHTMLAEFKGEVIRVVQTQTDEAK